MRKHRSFSLAFLASGLVALAAANGCSSDQGPNESPPIDAGIDADVSPPPSTLPDDAYGRASDPLPAGARLISPEELAGLVASGSAAPVSERTKREQEEAAVKREADDDRTLAPIFARRPDLARILGDPPEDPSVRKLGDGNFAHVITLANGQSAEVVTMGRRWSKHAAAQGKRRIGSYSGQLDLYRRLYGTLNVEWRRTLELVDPTVVESAPATYDSAAIHAMTKRVAAKADDLAKAFTSDPKPAGYVADCTQEFGAGTASDRSRDQPTCARAANGLFEKYVFPSKWYLTCVKDQNNRGTCSAFGDTSAIESWVARTHGRWVNLSEQALYNRARFNWLRGDYGDGLNAYDGFLGMDGENWLQPLEKSWNYNPSVNRTENDSTKQYTHSCDNFFETCSDSTHQSEMVCTKEGDYMKCAYVAAEGKNPTFDGYRITSSTAFWDVDDVETSFAALRILLAAGVPVVIGHAVTGAWDDAPKQAGYMLYKGTNDTVRGGHGIHAVGVIDNATLATLLPTAPAGAGGGYVIVKNSWSRCWADGGYIYVAWQSVKDFTPDATVLWGVQ